ncbi:MAG: delta-60 repeat domain-containing protein [Flavobacteriales bacterium]|nr:delta-60 repeat domain-containing protein [Flavobacteriales bacterium]
MLLGGSFFDYNELQAQDVARVNNDGSLDLNWSTGPELSVLTMGCTTWPFNLMVRSSSVVNSLASMAPRGTMWQGSWAARAHRFQIYRVNCLCMFG